MPNFSLTSLTTPKDKASWISDVITVLSSSGYNTDAWAPGEPPRDMIEMVAVFGEALTMLVNGNASSRIITTAGGQALTDKADSEFDEQRVEATQAAGEIVMRAEAGFGPYEVGPEQLTFAIDDTTWSNASAFTVPIGGGISTFVTASFFCDTAGTVGNNVNSFASASMSLQTQNVRIIDFNNPDIFGNSLQPGWLTVLGTDQEADETLISRCQLKFAALADGENTIDRIKFLIVEATQGAITAPNIKVDDQFPSGSGTADVYIAQALAVATGPNPVSGSGGRPRSGSSFFDDDSNGHTVQALNAITGSFMGARHGRIQVKAANAVPLNINGTVFYDPAFAASEVEDNVMDALEAMLSSTPLGGFDYTPGPSDVILLNDIVNAIEGADGVRTAVLTMVAGSPPSNVLLDPYDKAVLGTTSLLFTKTNSG